MMLSPVRTVAPAAIFTTAELKAHLRVDTSDEDTRIAAMGAAAESYLDGWAGIVGRCLMTQTWRQDLAGFPASDRIRLPLGPVTSITSITYRDTADSSQTLATSVYAGPFHDALGPYVILKTGQSWPSTYDREDAVAITFVAGAATAADVPAPIKAAVLLMVGDLYANRETVVIGAPSSKIAMSTTVDALLTPYRRIGF